MFDCNLALATKHIGELEFFIEEKDVRNDSRRCDDLDGRRYGNRFSTSKRKRRPRRQRISARYQHQH